MSALLKLKKELGFSLISPQDLKVRPGLPTGYLELDQYLLWHGLPKGELTMLSGHAGLGATTLWVQCSLNVLKEKKWVAWVNDEISELCPWILHQNKCDFSRVFVVSSPTTERKLLWVLQELINLSLFEVIGCDLTRFHLKNHHILKLKQLARKNNVAVVFIDTKKVHFLNPFYALVIQFKKDHLCIARAQHRSTPHQLPRRDTYENLMPQPTERRKALSGRKLSYI